MGANSAVEAMDLAREGAAAAEAKDYETYLAKMEAAVALRPDFPRLRVSLAAAQLAAERPDDAVATLEQLAAMGFSSPVDKSSDFAALRPRQAFQAVVNNLAANLHPRGSGEIGFTLRDVTGLIEGIAWREKTGQFFFGDVNGRAVWVREGKEGALRRFTPEGDDLLGVFGLAVDEESGALWAATSAVAAMRGFTPDQEGMAALAEIDLATGAVRRTMPVVRTADDWQAHVLGDLAVAADGTVFVTDSGAPTLWRLASGVAALERFVESDEFMSLQGVVLAPGGVAVLSDRVNGLLRVDLTARTVRRLEAPANTSLIGIDGLALAPDGTLLAVQRDLRPNRVLRVELDATLESVESVSVLESAHLTMAAPSLGCIATGGDFFFVGNAGWSRFDDTEGKPTPPRSVPIFRTKLPRAKK
ncbi:MAG: hypothetical protein ABIQ12_10725 [Opitutaceae bacterium]